MIALTDLDIGPDWVTATDDTRDHEVIVRRDRIESFSVNWLIAGGLIDIRTFGGQSHTIQFERDDHFGQKCADVISHLMKGTSP